MSCGGDGLGPKIIWRLEFRKHSTCHIHESPILPFGDTILLRGVRSGILLLDPLVTKKLVQGVVLEFGAICTSYRQDLEIISALNLISVVDDGILSLTLFLEEEYPCIS